MPDRLDGQPRRLKRPWSETARSYFFVHKTPQRIVNVDKLATAYGINMQEMGAFAKLFDIILAQAMAQLNLD